MSHTAPKEIVTDLYADATYESYVSGTNFGALTVAPIGATTAVTGVESRCGSVQITARRVTTYTLYRTWWNFNLTAILSGSSPYNWEYATKASIRVTAATTAAPDDATYDDVWGYSWLTPTVHADEFDDFQMQSIDDVSATAGIGYPEQKTWFWNTESVVPANLFVELIRDAINDGNSNIGVGIRHDNDVRGSAPSADDMTTWASHAHGTSGYRPHMTVTFTEPMVLFMGANF